MVFVRDEWWCQYCEDVPATVIDHIIPAIAGGSDDPSNLRASCQLCNLKASDKFFETYTAKREWLRHFREDFAKVRARYLSVCIQCRVFYQYGSEGATLFLCPDCTRKEYEE